MKSLKIIISTTLLLLFASILFSCKNSNNATEEIAVLKGDTLAEQYEPVVTDTFSNGEVRRIRFYNKDSKTAVYEKRYYKETGLICMEGPLDENQLRHGRWKAWYDCGKLWSVGDYNHGLRHGENMVYYVNGNIQYTKNYVNDTAEGTWKFFTEDGIEILEVDYQNGQIIEQRQLLNNTEQTEENN